MFPRDKSTHCGRALRLRVGRVAGIRIAPAGCCGWVGGSPRLSWRAMASWCASSRPR